MITTILNWTLIKEIKQLTESHDQQLEWHTLNKENQDCSVMLGYVENIYNQTIQVCCLTTGNTVLSQIKIDCFVTDSVLRIIQLSCYFSSRVS